VCDRWTYICTGKGVSIDCEYFLTVLLCDLLFATFVAGCGDMFDGVKSNLWWAVFGGGAAIFAKPVTCTIFK